MSVAFCVHEVGHPPQGLAVHEVGHPPQGLAVHEVGHPPQGLAVHEVGHPPQGLVVHGVTLHKVCSQFIHSTCHLLYCACKLHIM